MADGDVVLGGEPRLYRNSGTYGSPTWVHVSNCENLDFADSRTKVRVALRSMYPIAGNLPGLRDIALTWNMANKKGTADASLTAIQTAHRTGAVIELAVADGDITVTGTKYSRQICHIFKCDDSAPIDGVDMLAIEAAPSVNNGGNNPSNSTV